MKEVLLKLWYSLLRAILVVTLYGAMFWLTLNPVLRYFEVKEANLGQSIALLASIGLVLLFVKEI